MVSQKELSKILDISYVHTSRILTGRAPVSRNIGEKIAAILNNGRSWAEIATMQPVDLRELLVNSGKVKKAIEKLNHKGE